MEENKSVNSYLNPVFETLLRYNQLADFDRLWNLEAVWFEEPNRRRGGWSGVCRLELQGEDGEVVPVFLKRQENHRALTLAHPFKGISTARRELQSLLSFQKNGLPVPEIIYGADRVYRGQTQGILLTRELTGYQSLDDLLLEWQALQLSESLLEQLLFPPLAEIIREMHHLGFRHNCLYGKHIFARLNHSLSVLDSQFLDLDKLQFSLSFIDLEKMRQSRWKKRNIIRDLSQLKRHTGFSTGQWNRFLDIYFSFWDNSEKIRSALAKRKSS